MHYLDLTRTFNNSMPVYPGDPLTELKQNAHLDSDGYNEYHLSTGLHVGTHLDAPLHMIENGKMIDQLSLDRLIGSGKAIRALDRMEIDVDLLKKTNIESGDIVLIQTNHDRHWNTDKYYNDYPILTEAFAQQLVDLKVKLVGLDTPSPDKAPYPIHKILLKHGILIIENLTNLDQLPEEDLTIFALPAKLTADAAPVRVIAQIK